MSLLFNILSSLVIAFIPRRPILGKNIYGIWGSRIANDPFKAFCFFLHLGKASRYQDVLYPSLKLFSWFTVFVKSSQAPQFEGINSSYMTARKAIDLTIWTFVGKVIFLLFNMLLRFFIAFLPRTKHLLISWLQSLSAVILKPKKIKSVTVSIIFPSICKMWWNRMP